MQIIPVLNISQFEQDIPMSSFYANNLESHLFKNKNFFHRPHRHDFYLCVLFTKGTGVHEIDFNTYNVKPGSVFFLQPGQTHYWTFATIPEGFIFFHTQDFYELHFSKSKLEQFPFFHSYKNTPSLRLKENEIQEVASVFSAIKKEYQNDLLYKKQKIASLINTAYVDLARYYSSLDHVSKTTSVSYVEKLNVLEKTIESNYKTEKSVTFYANKLHVTSKHLNRISKTMVGKTTTDLITERVILESKRLIVHSDNSLATIAELLGYQDYAYFSKVFKKSTNSTPFEFKKRYR